MQTALMPQIQKPILRFWRGWLKDHLGVLLLASLLMAIVAAATSSYPIIIGAIIDALADLPAGGEKTILLGQNAKIIAKYGPLAIIIIATIKGIAWYLSILATNSAALKSTTKLQQDLFSKLLTLDYARISKEQSGAFASRFLNDVYVIREAVLRLANSLIREILILFGVIAAMLYSDWQLALVTIIILPLAFVPVAAIGQRLRKSTHNVQVQAAELSGVVEESLGGIRLVKTYSMETSEAVRVNKALDIRQKLLMKLVEQKGQVDPILELFGGAAIAGVFAFAAFRIANGASSVGVLMTFITSLLLASQSVRTLGGLSAALQEGVAGLSRFYDILDEEPTIKEAKNPINLTNPKGEIIFDQVRFNYEGKPALNGVSFVAKPSQTIALVGPSGAGKTTIINLVPRLYDIDGGKITIDGHNLRELSLSSLRNAIALVSQDATIFEATIAENIAFGTIGKSDAQIIDALQKAACDFVFALPEGIHTMVGPRGHGFSGGEKQRLSLARAILRDAPILLLDEATSALDSENEAKIAASLEKFCRGRTTLVVAHRLATVKSADLILVMNQGEIAEHGTHEELIAKNGLYADLAKLQLH